MQFLVPIFITAGVFGALGGAPQTPSDGGELWMRNAGCVWVRFILIATAAARLGVNDIADAKASFREQAIIFSRTHNWLMCVLYAGIFDSFIGFFVAFMALFFLTGVGDASTFQMIPAILDREVPRLMPELERIALRRQSERESAAIIAFTSAVAA